MFHWSHGHFLFEGALLAYPCLVNSPMGEAKGRFGELLRAIQSGQCHPQEALRTGGLLGLAEKATVKVGVSELESRCLDKNGTRGTHKWP